MAIATITPLGFVAFVSLMVDSVECGNLPIRVLALLRNDVSPLLVAIGNNDVAQSLAFLSDMDPFLFPLYLLPLSGLLPDLGVASDIHADDITLFMGIE